MNHDIGTLRSVLSHPGLTSWHVALKMLRGWPDAHEAAQLALPYVQSTVTRWPGDIVRWAPRELVNEMPSTPRAEVRGASLIQAIAIPSALARVHVVTNMASHGWLSPPLQRLEIADVRDSAGLLDVLELEHVDLSSVTSLTLRGCAMEDRHLRALYGLEALRHLDVSSDVLTGESVRVLCDPGLIPSLKRLDVRGNRFDELERRRLIQSARIEAGCAIEA